jgi:hypothetical protein
MKGTRQSLPMVDAARKICVFADDSTSKQPVQVLFFPDLPHELKLDRQLALLFPINCLEGSWYRETLIQSRLGFVERCGGFVRRRSCVDRWERSSPPMRMEKIPEVLQ